MSNTEPSAAALRAVTALDNLGVMADNGNSLSQAKLSASAHIIDREFAGERAKIEAGEKMAKTINGKSFRSLPSDIVEAFKQWQRACKGEQ